MGIRIEKIRHSTFLYFSNKTVRACFSSCGASIYSYSFLGHEWLFSPLDKRCFLSSKGFYGKTLGPIAGRYKTNGTVICHGGEHSLSFQEFDYFYEEKESHFMIEFHLDVDEKEAFYGNHSTYIVRYEIEETGEIFVQYKIIPREDTYASLSLHCYFCFAEEDIRELKAKIPAEKVSILNKDLSISSFVPVTKAFDFKEEKQLKETYIEKENLAVCGHYLKNVFYPIFIEGNKQRLMIDSSFPDGLIYLDSAPVGEVGLNKRKEKRFSCFVFEPEINPSDKDRLFIKANEERTNWIRMRFYSL